MNGPGKHFSWIRERKHLSFGAPFEWFWCRLRVTEDTLWTAKTNTFFWSNTFTVLFSPKTNFFEQLLTPWDLVQRFHHPNVFFEMSQVSSPNMSTRCVRDVGYDGPRSWTSLDPDVCDARFMSPQSLVKTSQLLFIFVHWKVKRHLQKRSELSTMKMLHSKQKCGKCITLTLKLEAFGAFLIKTFGLLRVSAMTRSFKRVQLRRVSQRETPKVSNFLAKNGHVRR